MHVRSIASVPLIAAGASAWALEARIAKALRVDDGFVHLCHTRFSATRSQTNCIVSHGRGAPLKRSKRFVQLGHLIQWIMDH
jgi:hypothetical protein